MKIQKDRNALRSIFGLNEENLSDIEIDLINNFLDELRNLDKVFIKETPDFNEFLKSINKVNLKSTELLLKIDEKRERN